MCGDIEEKYYLPWHRRFTLPLWLHYALTLIVYASLGGIVAKNYVFAESDGHGFLWLLTAVPIGACIVLPTCSLSLMMCRGKAALALACWLLVVALLFEAPFLILHSVASRENATSIDTPFWYASIASTAGLILPLAVLHAYMLYDEYSTKQLRGGAKTAFAVFMVFFDLGSELFDVFSGYVSFATYNGADTAVRNSYIAFATINYILLGPFAICYMTMVVGDQAVTRRAGDEESAHFSESIKTAATAILDFITDGPFLVIRLVNLQENFNAPAFEYALLAFNAFMLLKAFVSSCVSYCRGVSAGNRRHAEQRRQRSENDRISLQQLE